MSWFWMNVPADVVFFAAWCGIPLYMVLRHRSWGPERADSAGRADVSPSPAVKAAATGRRTSPAPRLASR
jgi:hypothetical protein